MILKETLFVDNNDFESGFDFFLKSKALTELAAQMDKEDLIKVEEKEDHDCYGRAGKRITYSVIAENPDKAEKITFPEAFWERIEKSGKQEYMCSKCKGISPYTSKYCPDCGRSMGGDSE